MCFAGSLDEKEGIASGQMGCRSTGWAPVSVCATIGSCDVQIEFGSMAMRRGCKVGWVGVGDGMKVAGKAPTFDRLVEGEGEVRCAVVRCGAVRCGARCCGQDRSGASEQWAVRAMRAMSTAQGRPVVPGE